MSREAENATVQDATDAATGASSTALEIGASSVADGATANQWSQTSCACQQWRLLREGIQ